MTEPVHDLSRLRIDRDRPSASSSRALKMSATLAVFAALFVAAVLWWTRGPGGHRVTVALVEVVGGGTEQAVGITANGYVVARTKASVSSRVSGRLAYLGVEEGSTVRRGEIIARLENDDYRAFVSQAQADERRAEAALLEAEAQRDQLRRDLARGRELLLQNLVSEREVEDLEAQLAVAEARVGVQEAIVEAATAAIGVAEANLENTIIRAPFDGTVLRKDAEVGEVVAPAATGGGLTRGAVVTMADLETLEVEVDVNEAYIAQIAGGQPARIILDAYPRDAYPGEVRQIVPTADRQRATVQVKVSILEGDERILPEMAARVEFLEDPSATPHADEPPRVFVPGAAVRDEAGRAFVWVVRNGTVTRTAVEAGPVSGSRREIRSGLSGGERVVTSGFEDLADGMVVEVESGEWGVGSGK
jgi:RND family efflux transporter MFP subunit